MTLNDRLLDATLDDNIGVKVFHMVGRKLWQMETAAGKVEVVYYWRSGDLRASLPERL